MGEGRHPSLSERGMRERRVDLIRERESCVKNEFVRLWPHDGEKSENSREREAWMAEGSKGEE